MADVSALSPRPTWPAHPPESTMLAVPPESVVLAMPPESALLPVVAAVTPPKADPHQWQYDVLQL